MGGEGKSADRRHTGMAGQTGMRDTAGMSGMSNTGGMSGKTGTGGAAKGDTIRSAGDSVSGPPQ